MHTSALDICLQNFQDGNVSSVEELCKQLANRILYIPTVAPIADEDSAAKVQVVENQETHRSLILVFTNQQKLKTWSVVNDHDGSSINLLGADFCAVLKDKWLLVNEGLEGEVELQPIIVERISELMFDEVPTDSPEDVSYLDRYSLENSDEVKEIENPILYHGRVNERNFIKTVTNTVEEEQSQAAEEVKAIEETLKTSTSNDIRKRKKTSANVLVDEEKAPRERKHTQGSIKSWDDEEKPSRQRKKTAQEGAIGAMKAWDMLKDSPPLGESIPVNTISDKATESQTKIMQTEVDPKDLGKISKKLQKSAEEKKESSEKEDKSIWGLFK